jgi:hypothetical protein
MADRIRSIEKNNLIGNQTLDLVTCRVVPHLITLLLRAEIKKETLQQNHPKLRHTCYDVPTHKSKRNQS